ncbi:N-6 DNA methylase [Streptomyces cavernae]|uniref:N-6 DNA methylase n=1 Tax=Streptomyces cavernae TaxID=2259034 RepID=UPI000FEB7476|nr:N-6 DNA methylase [Streptomyces cavernae]
MQDNATEVTAAGIARLAGVGRAAVSNWRRRHADFPRPVGGTETSPSFALAEVEDWLRRQGKLAEVPLKERVWQQLAGHPEGPVTGLVHAGGALLLIDDRPSVWREVSGDSDARLTELMPVALDGLLAAQFGPAHGRAVATPKSAALRPSVPLLRGTAELAGEVGARQAFAFLLGRYLDANPRQHTLTPPGLAELMAELAGPARTVLDPACGAGALLRAVAPLKDQVLHGQDSTPELAALTALRLALDTRATVRTAGTDSLRADAFDALQADAVLCHPPFNERNWGHEDLAYDPRWEYGFPARTESELAWVQHSLARLKDGGTAVVLMPPAVAARRSGRRIRADLLRRGALRAVIALPVGAAPPYNIPLHLWVLRRPVRGAHPAHPGLLLADAAPAVAADGRGSLDWQAVRTAVLDAWRLFDGTGAAPDRPGVSRCVPVVELLDDDVDLTPARHLPPPAAGGGARELATVRDRLQETLRLTADLTPPPATEGAHPRWTLTTVGELARGGTLSLRTPQSSGTSTGTAHDGHDRRDSHHRRDGHHRGESHHPSDRRGRDDRHGKGVAVLTDHDVLTGNAPSGTLADGDDPVLVEEGDVVVPVVGGGAVARVVDDRTAGAALGRGLALLRPDPTALDPWFLAGFLRGTANNRRASSYASTATRLDVRRLQLPRVPLDEQRRYGERFRALAEFEDALRRAGRIGEQLVQGMYDGLTDGTISPDLAK